MASGKPVDITITLLVMVAPNYIKSFYNKAAAGALFLKHHKSVCCYPLVMVDGKPLPNLAAARKFFGIKNKPTIPWVSSGAQSCHPKGY